MNNVPMIEVTKVSERKFRFSLVCQKSKSRERRNRWVSFESPTRSSEIKTSRLDEIESKTNRTGRRELDFISIPSVCTPSCQLVLLIWAEPARFASSCFRLDSDSSDRERWRYSANIGVGINRFQRRLIVESFEHVNFCPRVIFGFFSSRQPKSNCVFFFFHFAFYSLRNLLPDRWSLS